MKKDKTSIKELLVVAIIYVIKPVYFTQALLGILLGIYMCDNEIKFERLNKALGLLASLILIIAMYFTYKIGTGIFLFEYLERVLFILIAVLLFASVKQMNTSFIKENAARNIRKLSTIVYIIHAALVSVSNVIVRKTMPDVYAMGSASIVRQGLYFVLTLVMSIICGLIMIYISKFKYFKWLKKLY